MLGVKKIAAVSLVVSNVVFSTVAFALPASEVNVGSTYSLSNIGENRTVTALRVNRSSGRVLVRFHHTGREEWVSASRLMRSYGESFADDAAETTLWVLAIAALFDALADSDGSSSNPR